MNIICMTSAPCRSLW